MNGPGSPGTIAQRYREFAGYARGESACFTDWAERVAADPEVLAWLTELPEIKQQPNLVFAAARWHGVAAPGEYADLRSALLGDTGEIRSTILARATQTNEVGRLATLLPAFGLVAAQSSGPIALVEAGASAGLCLFPDRYDYVWDHAWDRTSLTGRGGPTLRAQVSGPAPLPSSYPEIAWRGGLDLNPLDVTDAEQMAWLTILVWPEDDRRREQLAAAIEVAAQEPPYLETGDLLHDLPALVDRASRHGTPVVFHSAVIAYLDDDARAAFAQLMDDLVSRGRCRWVSNEAPGVVPIVGVPSELNGEPHPARFVLAVDGRPVAWTHPHGRDLSWL